MLQPQTQRSLGAIKELEAIIEDFELSFAKLKQVQARFTQENDENAQRAELLKREMDEMRNDLVEIKMDGRINQDKLESSKVSIHDLIRRLMKERDRKLDDHMKSVSDMMQRCEADANNLMMESMATF